MAPRIALGEKNHKMQEKKGAAMRKTVIQRAAATIALGLMMLAPLTQHLPAASAQDGFEATVSVLKASEAVTKKTRIAFSKEWFQV